MHARFKADVFLALDELLSLQLLAPSAEKRKVRSLEEGGKLKKLLQYCRQLWRDSPKSAKSTTVLELKSMFARASPDGDSPEDGVAPCDFVVSNRFLGFGCIA